jgi:hypothetical protein
VKTRGNLTCRLGPMLGRATAQQLAAIQAAASYRSWEPTRAGDLIRTGGVSVASLMQTFLWSVGITAECYVCS